jgi:succinoglycan biosynthesis transport protein ExoP
MKPVKPRKALNLALGFFLGIFGGLGLAFFSEYLDHSIKTPQDVVEKVKLQLLASIPYLKGK